jgi:hypothetical protein
MTILVSRLTKTGELFVNGKLDEITKSINSISNDTIYSSEFDELSGISYIGSTTDNRTTGLANGNVLTMSYPPDAKIGDIAILAITASSSFGGGFTGTNWNNINTDTGDVKSQILYKIITSLTDETLNHSGGTTTGLTAVMSIFRNVNYRSFTFTTGTTRFPDPGGVTANVGMVIVTGHVNLDTGLVTAPTDFILANTRQNFQTTDISTTMVAYKINDLAGSINPSAFNFSGNTLTPWSATTINLPNKYNTDTILNVQQRNLSTGKLQVLNYFDEVTGIS